MQRDYSDGSNKGRRAAEKVVQDYPNGPWGIFATAEKPIQAVAAYLAHMEESKETTSKRVAEKPPYELTLYPVMGEGALHFIQGFVAGFEHTCEYSGNPNWDCGWHSIGKAHTAVLTKK